MFHVILNCAALNDSLSGVMKRLHSLIIGRLSQKLFFALEC